MWSMMVYLPSTIKYEKEFKKDPDFLKTIKLDWYDLDYKFLRDDPSFIPYKYIRDAGTVSYTQLDVYKRQPRHISP